MISIRFYGIWFTVYYEWEAGCEDTLDTPGTGERVYISSVRHGDTDFTEFMFESNLIDELEGILIRKIQ